MVRLEDLKQGAAVRGIAPGGEIVTVERVRWAGSAAIELIYKDASGAVDNQLLFRDDESKLEIVEEGRPWSFDGDGADFRLVSEAKRILQAYLFDVDCSGVPASSCRRSRGDSAGASGGAASGVPGRRNRTATGEHRPRRLGADLHRPRHGCVLAVPGGAERGGTAMTMREALALINATLDEVLAEQEGDFDADTRWAVTWFEQYGYDEADYGLAEQLSKAKNTSVDGLVESGAVVSSRGQVRLLRPAELPPDWDSATDLRRIVWETAQHLIRVLETGGEQAAAALVAELGAEAEVARDLAYRLYLVSERRGRAADARMYNGLVQSWLEIARLAQQDPSVAAAQSQMFEMAGPDDPA